MVSKKIPRKIRLTEYIETLQARGRLTFESAKAIQDTGLTKIALNRAAERLVQKKRLIHPARGFYVTVPVEHKLVGAPPAPWFIDALMKFHSQPYYVGLLSAAALHGASHQSPQEFQVITNKHLRAVQAGQLQIHFLTKKRIEEVPTQMVRTPSGDIPVSTPEATAFDLIQYVRKAGELSNVATVLIELAEKINPQKLSQVAEIYGEFSVAQRLGYLLDTFVGIDKTKPLHAWLEKQNTNLVALRPNWNRAKKADRSEKWNLLINEDVEPDV